MRNFLIMACRGTVLAAVLYGAFLHHGGAIFMGPAATLGLGLVGLGLCLDARRNATPLRFWSAGRSTALGSGAPDRDKA